MDLLAVNVRNVYNGSPFLRDSVCSLSCLSSSFGVEELRAFEISLLWRKVDLFPSRHRSLLVRAKAKKNHDSSSAYGNRDRPSSNGDHINDGSDPLSERSRSHGVNWIGEGVDQIYLLVSRWYISTKWVYASCVIIFTIVASLDRLKSLLVITKWLRA